MAGPFFDVYVVGAADATPKGLQALAGALSGPLGMSAAAISKALVERKLCAGKALSQEDAQSMVRQLKPMGALTVIRPTSPSDTPTRQAAPPARPVPPPPVRPGPPPPVRNGSPPTLSMGPPPTENPIAVEDPFAPPPSGPRALALDGPDTSSGGNPFGAPGSAPDLALAPPSGDKPAPAPPVGRDPFAGGPEQEDPRLELAMPPPSKVAAVPTDSNAEYRRPSTSLPGASALNLNRMSATSSASGLSVDKAAAAEAYRVRCHKHGLLYDTRKASGCGKCMDKGRKLSAAFQAQAAGVKIAQFDSAAKRAFAGLALALVIGFIPAAYHAFRVGARDIHRLRDEQELLSRKPATEEIVRQFEQLDTTVDNATSRATRTTGIVWLVFSGLSLVGWYRVTSET